MALNFLPLSLLLIFSLAGAQTAGDSILEELCSSPQGHLDNHTLQLNQSQYNFSNESCRVENVSNLTIAGSPGLTTILCELRQGDNITSSIFSFINVTLLRIENIIFQGCGAALSPDEDLRHLSDESRSYFGSGQSAVLICNHCKDLYINNVHFSNNTGYSFIGVNPYGNSVLESVEVFGGDDVSYNWDDPRCNETGYEYLCKNRGVYFFFADSEFEVEDVNVTLKDAVFNRNNFSRPHANKDDITSQAWCVRNVFGEFVSSRDFEVTNLLPDVGALTTIYTQINFLAKVNVLNSNFSDNHGLCFGAIFSLFLTSSPQNIHQLIQGCNFTDNSPIVAPSGEGRNYLGRGITIYMRFKGEYQEDTSIAIIDCLLQCHDHDITSPSLSIISFPDTSGEVGIYLQDLEASVSLKFMFISGLTSSESINVTLRDIRMVADHRYNQNLRGLDQNDGLLMFINLNKVNLIGTSKENCQFNNLLGPVILARSTDVILSGEMLFANNIASTWAYGAAILLQVGSTLWLKEPLKADFCNNSAVAGGAIGSTQLVDEFCIIQYWTNEFYTRDNISDIDITLTFTKNHAAIAGNSIYMTSLYNCSTRLSPSILPPIYPYEVYHAIFTFEDSAKNGLRDVSSQPKEICACTELSQDGKNYTLNCAKESMKGISTIPTYPGKKFSITIASVDEAHNLVYTTMYNNLHPRSWSSIYADVDNFGWKLGRGEDLIKVEGLSCVTLDLTIFNNVSEYSLGTLALYPQGEVYCLAVPIIMESCPPGFTLGDSKGCVCSQLLNASGLQCDINSETIVRDSSAKWVGVVSGAFNTDFNNNSWGEENFTIGYSETCHYIYCNKDLNITISHPNSTGAEICLYNRTGILCGQCPVNKSIVVGGPHCFECSNWWLLMIVLYMLVGVLFVCLLFLLRLTVVTGTINGIILFANLFQINTYYYFRFESTSWLWVFISALNLKLGFPICFYDGLTSLTSTFLSFAIPVYLWLIILAITLLSRRFRTVAALTSSTVIPVLATIIYISFSKVLDLVVHGFSFSVLHLETEDGVISQKYVWFYDGSVDFLKGAHGGLFFLSLVALMLYLVPYTIFFTGIKFFSRFQATERVRPFVDAFCAPYKDKWRFMFGLRLCLLILVYILYVALRFNPDLSVLLETVLLLLFTVLHVATMPYKNVFINYLDTFFLVDSVLLNVMALYGHKLEVISNVFITPVFLIFCGIVVYHIYLLIGREKFEKYLPPFRKIIKKKVDDVSSEEFDNSEGKDSERSSERTSLNSKSPHNTTYSTLAINDPPSMLKYKPGELREPLLEDSDGELT